MHVQWREGGTKDSMTVTGMREGCSGQEDVSLPSSVCRAAYNSLKFEETHHLSQNTLPSCMVAPALRNDRMSKMKNGSFSRLELLVRPP